MIGFFRKTCLPVTVIIILIALVFCSCGSESVSSGEDSVTSVSSKMSSADVKDDESSTSSPEVEQEEIYRDKLIISEIMSFNNIYKNKTGEYLDWIEIKNISDEDVNLADYYLSDDKDDRKKFNLPKKTLTKGSYYVVWCDDSCFSIGNDETVYLFDSQSRIEDAVDAANLRYSFSRGTDEETLTPVTYETPTPGSENGIGYTEESETPTLIGTDGVFNDVDSVTVTLSGRGTIRYTLDGSLPTEESQVYLRPFEISSTTVVRAVSFERGKLCSESLDLSYIINENHTLPVTSIVISPEDFEGEKYGMYNHPYDDLEKTCTVKFFDGDNGFYKRCSVQLHGATSKITQEKKSLKLKFKDVYGDNLQYDLFGNGVTDFSSVILRSAQEQHETTLIRDILFHELAQQCSSSISTQDYRFSVLYINGEYWGVYAYREAHSEKHYAEHTGYSKKDISLYEGEWPHGCDFEQYYSYALTYPMDDNDNYHYVADHLDLDSIITWALIEGYSGNIDVQPHNVKFYYTYSDEKLHYALIDLDLGGVSFSSIPFETGYDYSMLLSVLITNQEFRQLFLEKAREYLQGPLSDENVFALRDSLIDEIIDEIPRDAERWEYNVKRWQQEVDSILSANTATKTASKNFAERIKEQMNLTKEEYNMYLADIE